MRLSAKLPDEMSANERLKEIASILAKAVSRDNQDDANILKNLENKRGLTGLTDLSYNDLEISNGGEAMLQYKDFIAGKMPESEIEGLWQNLSAYCEQDTYAMVLLLDVLMKEQKNES